MTSTPLPCPFCGSKRLYIGPFDYESFGVKCRKCGAAGPRVMRPAIHVVPKQFRVNGRVPMKNFAASEKYLAEQLTRRAFELWQNRSLKRPARAKAGK